MAGQYVRLLDARELTASSAVMDTDLIPDLGAYRVLEVQIAC
jgi:hypothetical protein